MDDVQRGLRKKILEVQEKILGAELDARFSANMMAFKKYYNTIYTEFVSYTPKTKRLFSDPLGFVNLSDEGVAVYTGDPKKDSRVQVEYYLQNPMVSNGCMGKVTDEQTLKRFAGIGLTNKLVDIGHKYNAERTVVLGGRKVPEKIPFMMMLGLGLGYHLESLLEEVDVRSLCIHEMDMDVFYATLYTIDWVSIIERYRVGGRVLLLEIGGTISSYSNNVAKLFESIGMFNAAKIYIYKHCDSNEYDKALEKLNEIIRLFYAGWGFFEDELISVAHTLTNMSNNVKLYDNTASLDEDVLGIPVILVGNGPSLDDTWKIVKSMEGKAIIIGCSQSSLKTLYEYGIRPDFFCVMERLRCIKDWLDVVKDDEYKSKIKFISVNHVHPEVGQGFSEWGMALKTFDSGARLISQIHDDAEKHIVQHAANAGVNTAISIVGELGFKSCYLFGLDLGYRNKKNHHSKNSAYFEKNRNSESKVDLKRHVPGDLERPGNFGGTVFTESVMEASRMSMEFSLMGNKQLRCYNCSDGVAIKGAEALDPYAVNFEQEIENKKSTVEYVFQNGFPHKTLFSHDTLSAKFDVLWPLFDELIVEIRSCLDMPAGSLMEVADLLLAQHNILRRTGKSGQSMFRTMMSGTMSTLQTQTLFLLSSIASEDNYDEMWAEIKAVFVEYLDMCRKKMKQDYRTLDSSRRFEA